ncbi:MAG: type II secretion system F family protein, partial [Hyphomicrobiales bacterium]|nr:type II secretion system F family protein [Hyphomicrobiales bacterium]
ARAFARVRSFPPFLGRMLAIGEDARRLGPTMTRAAGVLERQAADATERALAILTPALTIVIAAMVGGLIFLTMTSILDLNDLATR